MSYTRSDAEPVYQPRRPMMLAGISGVVRVAIWSVLNAVLVFVEHLSELLAPFLLIGGAIWWAIPKGLAAITLDGPPGEVLAMVRTKVPHDLYLEGSYYSASTLIWDGIYLVAIVAICRTLSTAITTLLIDRR